MLTIALHLALAVPFAPVPEQPVTGAWVSTSTWMQVSGYEDDAGIDQATLLVQLRRDPGAYDGRTELDAGPISGFGSWVTFEEDDAGWCWRAQAVNVHGEGSGWGPEACFSVDTTPPPRPLGMDAGPAMTSGAVTVHAPPVVDARSALEGYVLVAGQSADGPWFLQRSVVSPALPLTTHLGPGTWQVAVEAIDLAGNTSAELGDPVEFRAVSVRAVSALPTPPAPSWSEAFTNDWGDGLGYDDVWAADAGAQFMAYSIREVDGGWHHVDTLPVAGSWPHRWIGTHAIHREGVFLGRTSAIVNGETSDWSAESAPLVVDATEPSPPTGLSLTPAASRDAPLELRWSPSTDNLAGVEHYKVSLTNHTTGATEYHAPTGTMLSLPARAEGRWSFTVRARDRADNWSESSAGSGEAVIDRTGPAASAPTVEPVDAGVVLTWAPPIDALSTVTQVELGREASDGTVTVVGALTSPAFDAPPEGTWRWRVRARDALGNEGAFGPPSPAVIISAGGEAVVQRRDPWNLRVGCVAAPGPLLVLLVAVALKGRRGRRTHGS